MPLQLNDTMASSSLIEDSHDRKISAEVSPFASFLTEDMLDAAMTNIQDIVGSDNEDRTFLDDESSGTSSNVSVKGDATVQEDDISGQIFIPETDRMNLNLNNIFVQSTNRTLQNSKKNSSSEDMVVNSKIIAQNNLHSVEIIEDVNAQEKDNSIDVLSTNNDVVFDTEGNNTKTIIKDVEGQTTDKENCLNTGLTAKDKYDNINNKENIRNVEIILIEDSNSQTSNNESRINSEMASVKIADELKNQETLTRVQTSLTMEEPTKILRDTVIKEQTGKNNPFGTNDEIISSIKEAFQKIYTKRENRTFQKPVETENQFDILDMDERQIEENKRREKVIPPSKEAGIIEDITCNTDFDSSQQKVTKNFEGKNSFFEETSSNPVCNDVENSSNEVDRNFEEIMDYEEISDDDCGLKIDDNLEKEIENNLMAEIGLTPQEKKTCFVLDDPDVEEILDVEREEAEKLDNDSITLYRADDAETTDASSMVECVLNNNEVGPSSSPLSNQKHLLPNTSYSELCNMIVPTNKEKSESKQMKMIYMNSNKKPEVLKQVPPGLKQILNKNKNVKCVLKLNGNVAVNNLLNKKLKLVPVHKPILSSPFNNLVPIKEPTLDETEFKKQVIENQLPPYKSSTVKASDAVYRCDDCGDTFLVQSSLVLHLARRSVVISYWCRICCSTATYYNRCLLLKHVRLHKQSVDNIDLNSVSFKPISKEMLERGIPKTLTQEWEENSVKNISLKYSIANFQTGKNMPIINKSKTLTSVVNIPRENASSTSPNNKVPSNIILQHFKPFTNVNGQSTTETIIDSEFSQVGNDGITSCTPNLDGDILCNDDDVNIIESQSSETVSQTDDRSHEIRINEVYSIHDRDKIISDEVNPVVVETVSDFKNILLDKTEKQVPQISVKTFPLVESDLPSGCKIISMPTKNLPSNSTVKKKSKENSQSNKLKIINKEKVCFCSECGLKLIDMEMEKHLNRLQQPSDQNLVCRVCRLILPSKCALKIHLRFHMKLPPYKCPECGKQFPKFEKLLIHLKYVCGHLSRHVKYICSKCRRPCSNLVQLESHIFSLHTNRVFKCSMCPVAFFNLSSMRKHKNKEHPNSDIFPFTYQQCTLCPDLIPKGKVPQHISEHARNPSQLTYAFNCPGCKKWFTNNRLSFITHLSWCPRVSKELEKFNDKDVEDTSKNEKPVVEDGNHNYSGDSDSVHDEPTIIKPPDVDDDIIELNEKDPLSLEDWEGNVEQHVREKRIEMCIVCKEEPVIILPGTDLNTQSLCCKLCVKPLSSEIHQNRKISHYREKSNIAKCTEILTNKNSIDTVIGRKRSSRPIKRKMSLDFEYDTTDYSLASANSEKSDSTCSSPENKKLPKTRIKIKKSKVETSSEESGINFVSGQIIPEKQSNSVVCSKCGFTANNVDEFRNHVVIHRTDPNAYQCLECGLCFVVRPSLEKHLIVLHRIKNVEEYIQNNDVGGERTVKEEKEEATVYAADCVEENQCRVCFLKLDSPASLDKHFRTHGMAFLMSSQRQSKKV